MAKEVFIPFLFLILASQVQSATIIEKSYEYVVNFGKSIAPSLMSIWECMGEEDAWSCAKEKAGKILDGFGEQVQAERRSWQAEADAEVSSSGRSFEELPSKLGREVEEALSSLTEVMSNGVARALSKKHGGGGIDSITISTGGEKKKMKKKKPKPPKIHLLHPVMMPTRTAPKEEKGRGFPSGKQTWVIGSQGQEVVKNEDEQREQKNANGVRKARFDGEWANGDEVHVETDQWGVGTSSRNSRVDGEWKIKNDNEGDTDQWGVEKVATSRGIMADLWSMGQESLDVLADAALDAENKDNGVQDKSSFEEQRGKKKKKKKAILKLLILGAVLKAKIGTLLQILSFKLQVKFFILALLGLAINLARLWIDLKNKHNHQPQKVIYYEHAQHQHHYDHEDEHESHGWGPWSRSMEPEETEVELDVDQNTPYRAQERMPQPYLRPVA